MIFVTATPNTLGGFIYTRSEYNAKGQLTKQYQDTGSGTESTAPTLYEYDAFGNMVKQTLALSATLASKSISTDVRGNVSMNWAEYTAPAKVTSFSSVPGSNIIAEVVTVDGFTLSQTDNSGVTTTNGRSYHNDSGLKTAKTYADNTSVVKTYDAYNRVLTETDARGKVKANTYEPARGPLPGTTYRDSTPPCAYTYNHLGQLTQVTDAAGVRTLSYNSYGGQIHVRHGLV